MEYNRTQIDLERHPGRLAYALDAAKSIATRRPRQCAFDGVVGRDGYSIEQAVAHQHARPVRLAVREVNENGTIPADVYTNLVEALRTLHDSPTTHPVLIRYDSDLDITDWDLKLRVGGISLAKRGREAA